MYVAPLWTIQSLSDIEPFVALIDQHASIKIFHASADQSKKPWTSEYLTIFEEYDSRSFREQVHWALAANESEATLERRRSVRSFAEDRHALLRFMETAASERQLALLTDVYERAEAHHSTWLKTVMDS